MLRGNTLGWTTISSKRRSDTPSPFMLGKLRQTPAFGGGGGGGGLLGLSTDLTYFLHKKYEHEKVTSTGHGRATDGKKRYTHFERFKSINVQYSDG